VVPIAKLDAGQINTLTTGLSTNPLGGFTPTGCAHDYAVQLVQSWTGPAEFANAPPLHRDADRRRPTITNDCQTLGAIKARGIPLSEGKYDVAISAVAGATTVTGIRTFMVGAPGSEDPQGANYDTLYML
jgi:hypothetical protein